MNLALSALDMKGHERALVKIFACSPAEVYYLLGVYNTRNDMSLKRKVSTSLLVYSSFQAFYGVELLSEGFEAQKLNWATVVSASWKSTPALRLRVESSMHIFEMSGFISVLVQEYYWIRTCKSMLEVVFVPAHIWMNG